MGLHFNICFSVSMLKRDYLVMITKASKAELSLFAKFRHFLLGLRHCFAEVVLSKKVWRRHLRRQVEIELEFN